MAATLDGENVSAVYLCQVGERVSCGACCGLYNVADLSRDALEDRLARRTERFAAVARSEDGGETWVRVTEGFPQGEHVGRIGIDLCLKDPSVMYALVDNQFEEKEEAKAEEKEEEKEDDEYYRRFHDVFGLDLR